MPTREKAAGTLAEEEKSLGLLVEPGSRQANDRLIEPLSERELEVLRLLATGLTPKEVAERFVLSPNTLKAHTQNIYSKLDAHSRIEAVNKARELGLI